MEHIPPGSFNRDRAPEGIGKREIMLGPCGQNYQEAANQCWDSYGHLVQLIVLQGAKILTKYNCRLKSSLIRNISSWENASVRRLYEKFNSYPC